MKDLTFVEMHQMQRELNEKYRGKWEPNEPSNARNQLLWMIGEAGEVIDIIKKLGDDAICADAGVRAAFVEEMVDVLMYFNDVLLCYGVSAGDIAAAYRAKHAKNMFRSYEKANDAFRERLSEGTPDNR